MSKKFLPLILLFVLLISSFISYKVGQESIKNNDEEIEFLYSLNRSELEKLVLIDGPVYVIGHKAPDSDTVCSAIGYASLLNKLGIEAKPMITAKPNNETMYILEKANIQVPEELYDAAGLNIMLVDHSEYSQAVDELIDANIVGIIDHHGVGSVNTGYQVLYNAKPIGSTATIVWMTYLNYGIEIDYDVAYALLGAILSDTSNLTASTTISADIKAVEELNKIVNIDINSFYSEIHERLLSYDGYTDEEIFFLDYKEYESSGIKYGIGAVNAIDEKSASDLAKRMKKAMEECFNTREVDLMYASVRVDNKKIDYIVPANEYSETILKSAFPDYDEFDGTAYIFKSGLGRKSKFVPGLNDYLGAKPHE